MVIVVIHFVLAFISNHVYIHNDNQIVASVSMVYWIYLLLKFIKFLNNAVIIKTNVLYGQAYVTLDRIICLLCVYICHYIFSFYYLDIYFDTVCQKKKKNVQIIKRKYIMTNINTQKTDYSV